jgi:hypothetical protein
MVKIDLDVGSQLVLEIKTKLNKIKCAYVGLTRHGYIIIEIDKIHEAQNLHNLLYKGHPIKVRYLSKGKVYGFISSIDSIIFTPDKLIFINYPNVIEEQNIRSQKRIVCSILSKMSFEEVVFKGIVVDISKNGCKFNTIADETSDKQLTEKTLDDFVLRCSLAPENIKLGLKLYGSPHYINIVCKQKNMSKDNNCAVLGLEFISMSDEDSIIFYDYLLGVNALPIVFNFPLCVIKHKVWMKGFKAYLNESKKISKKELISSRESELGKWLYEEGLQMYSHLEDMIQLENTNEALHKFVLDYVKELPEKYSNEQKEWLISRIDKISQEIINLLNTIEKRLIEE